MIDLKELNRIYKSKEKADLGLLAQLKLIRKVLGCNFVYKDFEYTIPDTILAIDDILDIKDGILDIFCFDGYMNLMMITIDKELLKMNEPELVALKENN